MFVLVAAKTTLQHLSYRNTVRDHNKRKKETPLNISFCPNCNGIPGTSESRGWAGKWRGLAKNGGQFCCIVWLLDVLTMPWFCPPASNESTNTENDERDTTFLVAAVLTPCSTTRHSKSYGSLSWYAYIYPLSDFSSLPGGNDQLAHGNLHYVGSHCGDCGSNEGVGL